MIQQPTSGLLVAEQAREMQCSTVVLRAGTASSALAIAAAMAATAATSLRERSGRPAAPPSSLVDQGGGCSNNELRTVASPARRCSRSPHDRQAGLPALCALRSTPGQARCCGTASVSKSESQQCEVGLADVSVHSTSLVQPSPTKQQATPRSWPRHQRRAPVASSQPPCFPTRPLPSAPCCPPA